MAASVALGAVVEFLDREWHDLAEVRMVLYTREDAKAYTVFAEALERLVAARVTGGAAEPGAAADRGLNSV
ncbi:MAG: hypothetical protein J0H57_13010 [Rhodospirillales bacterium]|nr:hypothetical protein [Rhodospirillales bacterium]